MSLNCFISLATYDAIKEKLEPLFPKNNYATPSEYDGVDGLYYKHCCKDAINTLLTEYATNSTTPSKKSLESIAEKVITALTAMPLTITKEELYTLCAPLLLEQNFQQLNSNLQQMLDTLVGDFEEKYGSLIEVNQTLIAFKTPALASPISISNKEMVSFMDTPLWGQLRGYINYNGNAFVKNDSCPQVCDLYCNYLVTMPCSPIELKFGTDLFKSMWIPHLITPGQDPTTTTLHLYAKHLLLYHLAKGRTQAELQAYHAEKLAQLPLNSQVKIIISL